MEPTTTTSTQPSKELPEAISIRMAATLLGVHHITVRRWIRRRYILAYRIGPLIVRIPRSEIARLRKIRVGDHADPLCSKYGRSLDEYKQV